MSVRDRLRDVGVCYYLGSGAYNARKLAVAAMNLERMDALHVHYRLTDERARAEFREKIFDEFHEEVEQARAHCDTFIISSEHLHSALWEQEEVERVHALIGSLFLEIKVIVYFRPQIEVAISRYSTRLRSGYTGDAVLSDGFTPHSHYFNYSNIFNIWRNVFGNEKIAAINFAEVGDVVSDFARTCGIELEIPSIRVNERLNAAQIAYMRFFNQCFPAVVDGRPNRKRSRLVDLVEGAAGPSAPLVTRTEARAFQARFDESNEALRKAAFPDRARLFEVDFEKFPEVLPDSPAGHKEVMDVVAHVLDRAARRMARREN